MATKAKIKEVRPLTDLLEQVAKEGKRIIVGPEEMQVAMVPLVDLDALEEMVVW